MAAYEGQITLDHFDSRLLDQLIEGLRLPRSFEVTERAGPASPPPPLPPHRAALAGRLMSEAARFAAGNAEPAERWKEYPVRPDDYRHDAADTLIDAVAGPFRLGSGASYNPGDDTLSIPHPAHFHDGATFYATALHELGHWTGPRLRREFFGSGPGIKFSPDFPQIYAREEMIAEFTSAFLCDALGIEPKGDLFSDYIGNWARLGDALDFMPQAAAYASQAADYILNRRH